MSKTIYLICFFVILTGMSVSAQYHKQLKAIAYENRLIGMSVAVVCNGEIKDIYHYGMSDLERRIEISDQTMFRIASISKTITASALMKLYEQGLFNLDDDISEYLGYPVVNPNFPDKAITFRMLLTHTSGLQDSDTYTKFLMTSYKQNPPPQMKELLVHEGSFFHADLWSNHTPGTFFTYCNLNYGIIGTLIEKLSGERFDHFVRKQLLEPLSIKGSFNTADLLNINELSPLYRNSEPTVDDFKGLAPSPRDLSGYRTGDNGIVFGPQGGFRVSAADLCKFMIMHMNNGEYKDTRILETKTVELMHSSQWRYNGSNGDNYKQLFNEWGLGFHLTTNTSGGDLVFEDMPACGHSGNAYGLISSMYFDKKSKFGLVFITNGYYGEKDYSSSGYSAFYQPEAEVFKLVEKYFRKPCVKDNRTRRKRTDKHRK